MIKNYFRILKKPHAYLQTILKTPVKFQKDRTETVGGVKGTKYPLKTRNHAPRTTRYAPRATHHGKPKTVSLHFSSKRRGTTRAVVGQRSSPAAYILYCNIFIIKPYNIGHTDLDLFVCKSFCHIDIIIQV